MHSSRPLLESSCTDITSRKHCNGNTCSVQRYTVTENIGLVGNIYMELNKIIPAVYRPTYLSGKLSMRWI